MAGTMQKAIWETSSEPLQESVREVESVDSDICRSAILSTTVQPQGEEAGINKGILGRGRGFKKPQANRGGGSAGR